MIGTRAVHRQKRNDLVTRRGGLAMREASFQELIQRVRTRDEATAAELIDHRPAFADVVANQELLGKVFERLSPEERHLAEERALGRSWDELASELGVKSDTLRKRLTRALDQVAVDLSL